MEDITMPFPTIWCTESCYRYISMPSFMNFELVAELCCSFSPTSRLTHACTDASRPGWTPGSKSMWPVTWLPTATSGWWGMSKRACCPAPPPAALRSCIISTLTSTGWSTERCSLCGRLHATNCHWRLHSYSSFMWSFSTCCYWI